MPLNTKDDSKLKDDTKPKDIDEIKDFLIRRESERRIKTGLDKEAPPDKEIVGCKDVILKSPKLLRLFTEAQQIRQLTIKINNSYRGRNISNGYAWGIIHELIKLGLIEMSKYVRYKTENTTLKYYILTSKGWEIAYPQIYPPNLHEENKVESVIHKLLNEAHKPIIPKVVDE